MFQLQRQVDMSNYRLAYLLTERRTWYSRERLCSRVAASSGESYKLSETCFRRGVEQINQRRLSPTAAEQNLNLVCRCQEISWPPYFLTPRSFYFEIFWPPVVLFRNVMTPRNGMTRRIKCNCIQIKRGIKGSQVPMVRVRVRGFLVLFHKGSLYFGGQNISWHRHVRWKCAAASLCLRVIAKLQLFQVYSQAVWMCTKSSPAYMFVAAAIWNMVTFIRQ